VVGVIGVWQDVTQELAQQADHLRLIATANALIVGIDAKNCVNEWNQKAVTLTGFTREEAMGKPLVEEFIEPQAQDTVREVLDNALQGKPQDNYQLTLMTKDKQPLQVRYDRARSGENACACACEREDPPGVWFTHTDSFLLADTPRHASDSPERHAAIRRGWQCGGRHRHWARRNTRARAAS
jgi:PAS domain S-box-containing protein